MRMVAAVGAVVGAAGLLVLSGCSDSGAPTADPTPDARTPAGSASAAPSAAAPSLDPSPDPVGAAPTPSGFVVTGIDCGLLDQRQDATDPGADPGSDDGFVASDRCIANALATGQAATFRLVTESLDGEAVFALFAVDGPGRLTITEDHRAVVVSEIDERVKTCTGARSLSAQGACEARDVPRSTDG